MFKLHRKWIYIPDFHMHDSIEKLTFMKYGPWKPVSRFIEFTVQSDCECPHFLFTFKEDWLRYIEYEENGSAFFEELQKTVNLVSITFYPEYNSEMFIFLESLAEEDLRGRTRDSAIFQIFLKYLIEDYDSSNKCVSGFWMGDQNPLPEVFPKLWNFYKKNYLT